MELLGNFPTPCGLHGTSTRSPGPWRALPGPAFQSRPEGLAKGVLFPFPIVCKQKFLILPAAWIVDPVPVTTRILTMLPPFICSVWGGGCHLNRSTPGGPGLPPVGSALPGPMPGYPVGCGCRHDQGVPLPALSLHLEGKSRKDSLTVEVTPQHLSPPHPSGPSSVLKAPAAQPRLVNQAPVGYARELSAGLPSVCLSRRRPGGQPPWPRLPSGLPGSRSSVAKPGTAQLLRRSRPISATRPGTCGGRTCGPSSPSRPTWVRLRPGAGGGPPGPVCRCCPWPRVGEESMRGRIFGGPWRPSRLWGGHQEWAL